MKPGLAVLPLEVWADIFLSPYQWFTRQELAHIADGINNRNFSNKLQKLLHDCGKATLGFLRISSKRKKNSWKYQMRKCKNNSCKYRQQWKIKKIPKRQAALSIVQGRFGRTLIKDCEFPQCEMPENIKQFEEIDISYIDDQVMDLLTKIKPLFANVILCIDSIEYDEPAKDKDVRILLTHLLPMLTSIRGIECNNNCHYCIGFLERHFPGTLARAKELELYAELASIPAFLDWLSAPQDFNVHGPRFLHAFAESTTINAMINDVRKQFLTATTPSTFVIILEFDRQDHRVEEFKLENAATNEQLTLRNATFKDKYGDDVDYVEILRNPAGAEAKMQEWIQKRAYFEKECNYDDDEAEQQTIMMGWSSLTIGHITKKVKGKNQSEDETDGEEAEDEAGPSASAKRMKKK